MHGIDERGVRRKGDLMSVSSRDDRMNATRLRISEVNVIASVQQSPQGLRPGTATACEEESHFTSGASQRG